MNQKNIALLIKVLLKKGFLSGGDFTVLFVVFVVFIIFLLLLHIFETNCFFPINNLSVIRIGIPAVSFSHTSRFPMVIKTIVAISVFGPLINGL
jgi:hypothetical protein